MRRLLALIETDGEGVLLVDLMRIAGGSTHWRLCRGCGPEFSTAVSGQAQAGTFSWTRYLAGRSEQPDPSRLCGAGLYGSSAAVQCPGCLDRHVDNGPAGPFGPPPALRQFRHPSPQCASYRNMGSPDESTYNFCTLSWQRDASDDKPTCIDLAFEPRVGPSDPSPLFSL